MESVKADMEARGRTIIYCLCRDHRNEKKYSRFDIVHMQLILCGFQVNYTCWNKHGEKGHNERGEGVQGEVEGVAEAQPKGKARG